MRGQLTYTISSEISEPEYHGIAWISLFRTSMNQSLDPKVNSIRCRIDWRQPRQRGLNAWQQKLMLTQASHAKILRRMTYDFRRLGLCHAWGWAKNSRKLTVSWSTFYIKSKPLYTMQVLTICSRNLSNNSLHSEQQSLCSSTAVEARWLDHTSICCCMTMKPTT